MNEMERQVLMLGWEYPPAISGGLGTACKGIVTALAARQVSIIFAAPSSEKSAHDPRVRFVDLDSIHRPASPSTLKERIKRMAVNSPLRPYMKEQSYADMIESATTLSAEEGLHSILAFSEEYGTDLANEVVRYAEAIEPIASSGGFQLVHAHDWMTFPAALHVKEMTGVPAILHVHSLELDRCPDGTDDRIFKIEKTSFKAADHIIAVSFYTKNRLVQRYDVPEWKISVIHNAVSRQDSGWSREVKRPYGKKIVLFLGRITSQKGPEYFIDAAAQVIEQDDSVWFVMAGSGDMLPKMIERTAQLKIGRNFHFTGFLHGSDVEKMYSMSDVYVMPSISEPFGITGLEAILYDVPVILTKQAGVSEVLHHALTVDYWNVDELATAILSVLKHPAMRDSMVRMCKDEIEGVCWERAAEKIDDVYRNVLAGVGGT